MRTDIDRTVLNISTFCNLKCRNCLAFIPYYKEPKSMGYQEAKETLNMYFKVVDSVKHFTVTGGEPLLNKDCYSILKEVFGYQAQIRGSIDFVTNGTIMIPDQILTLFEEHADHCKIVISNYGEHLSKKVDEIEKELKKRNIPYRISKFYGDNLYYDGWIDFSNHSLKWKSVEERDMNAQQCVQRKGKYFVINEGEIHCCSRSFWRIHEKIIPKVKGEYVPLMDMTLSIEEKRADLLSMYQKKSSTSCAYCVGLCNGVKRVKPAEQMK